MQSDIFSLKGKLFFKFKKDPIVCEIQLLNFCYSLRSDLIVVKKQLAKSKYIVQLTTLN